MVSIIQCRILLQPNRCRLGDVVHFEDYDNECMVYDRPGTVELDIIIKNGLLMLCELKSSMSRADMFAFYKKTVTGN